MVRAAELNPKDSDTRLWLGRIIAASGDSAGATSEFEKSIGVDKSNTEAYAQLIEALLLLAEGKQRHSNDQISLYEKALRYTADGIEHAKSGQDDTAIRQIQEFRKHSWNALAYSYAERGENLSLAMNYIEETLKLDPTEPHFLDTKAWILIRISELSKGRTFSQKQSDYGKAEALLTQSLTALPADDKGAKAETLFHLGYLEKLRGGKDDRARQLFVRALQLNPQHERAKQALQ
jgi:tetratricopeptide (TPR) repeat protein